MQESDLGNGFLVADDEEQIRRLGNGKATKPDKDGYEPPATLVWESPRGDLRVWIAGCSWPIAHGVAHVISFAISSAATAVGLVCFFILGFHVLRMAATAAMFVNGSFVCCQACVLASIVPKCWE